MGYQKPKINSQHKIVLTEISEIYKIIIFSW